MHISDLFPDTMLFSFLLALSRLSGLFAFIPVPGIRTGPDAARILASLALTVALYPFWPAPPSVSPTAGDLVCWVLAELAVGVAAGLAISLALECFQFAGQLIGLQAGYSYAATIDPNSQSDSGVILVFAQLLAGFLFFSAGMDRQLIRALALSLQTQPAGIYHIRVSILDAFIHLGADVFVLGLRLALPEIALLVLIDLCFGILGRMLPQIQFLLLSFPVKMLAGIIVLALTLSVFPLIWTGAAEHALAVLSAMGRK